MASDKALFAERWYEPVNAEELRQEILNLYALLRGDVEEEPAPKPEPPALSPTTDAVLYGTDTVIYGSETVIYG